MYGTSDKQQEVIQRCLEHFMETETAGTARYSMILVGNSLAEYFYDQTTKRLCVGVPYERPKGTFTVMALSYRVPIYVTFVQNMQN